MIRVSRKRMEELALILSERDKAVLNSLKESRYLTSGQIQRLHFIEHTTPPAALRSTNRAMVKLQGYGLVEALERRIGGVRGGSGSYVWLLTEAGGKILHLNDDHCAYRKRFTQQTSMNFVNHTLAVAETYVQMTEICKRHSMELVRSQLEPSCWRAHIGENNKSATLKPDLFAVIANGEYEDSWFIEVDLNTESPMIVLDKCRRYAHYYRTGAEQRETGVFPLVVWIVPNGKRKSNLRRYIDECRELQLKSIFLVITPDEFETLICEGKEALV